MCLFSGCIGQYCVPAATKKLLLRTQTHMARTLAVVTEPSTIREGACAVITVSDLTDLAHIFVVAAIFATRLTALIPVAAGLVFTDIPPTAAATTECIIAITTSVAEGS